MILAVSGENRVFSQTTEQDSPPAVSPTPQAAYPGTRIPAPRRTQPRLGGAPNLAPNARVMASPQVVAGPGAVGSVQAPFGQAFALRLERANRRRSGPPSVPFLLFLERSVWLPVKPSQRASVQWKLSPAERGRYRGAGRQGLAGPWVWGLALRLCQQARRSLQRRLWRASPARSVPARLANLPPAMIGDQSPYSIMKALAGSAHPHAVSAPTSRDQSGCQDRTVDQRCGTSNPRLQDRR